MKCVVLGYHNMGCAGIEALIEAGFEITAVFTHKDNPNENIWFDSVAECASKYGIPAFAPEDINHPVWVNRIKAMEPDFIFSFYYRSCPPNTGAACPSTGPSSTVKKRPASHCTT